ncbi:MAG: hypothetical protein J6A15_06875 [Clostridia bacterium]|nr:hypothetical protein [Clostridia bacterium]
MEDEFCEGEIVFLRFMRFPDDNSIDYRMNGRPYLIYKVTDENIYLFKIGRSKVDEDYCYHPIKIKNKKKDVECYVDLRNLVPITEEELINKITALHDGKKAHRNSMKRKSLPEKDFEKVKEKFNNLVALRNYSKMLKNYKLVFNE